MDKPIVYKYKFKFVDGKEKDFELTLDSKTLNLVQQERKNLPDWTELKNFRCPNCTLDENRNRYCPIAVNIIDVVEFFRKNISYEEVDVVVESDARKYVKHTALQKGVSSLMGIYMTTSGCPVMEKLKPMVRYHLPFATMEETSHRIISMYLIAQYFLYKKGKNVDLKLEKLAKIYDNVKDVNQNICGKLSQLKIEDAILNALVSLDCFASSMSLASYEEVLEKLEYGFRIFE